MFLFTNQLAKDSYSREDIGENYKNKCKCERKYNKIVGTEKC